MKEKILFFILFTLVICHENCKGTVNETPLIDQEPQQIRSVENGTLYYLEQGDVRLFIANVSGTSYQMGFAYGQLMKEEIQEDLHNFFEYLTAQGDDWLKTRKLPKFIRDKITATGLEAVYQVLDLLHMVTSQWTPKRYSEELQGIADGAGIEYKQLRRINLFPELIRASCTMAGVWGSASLSGQLLQLRALDWDRKAPMSKFPTIVVYHPIEQGSSVFANIGYAGLIGVLTGYSQKIGISEKVWYPPEDDTQKFNYFGQPWMYVLRDTLQFGQDLDSAIKILTQAKRTVHIHVGVGSKQDNQFRGVIYNIKNYIFYKIEYSYKRLRPYDDKNLTYYSDAHPQMDGVMYWDKYAQPSSDSCMGSILQENYGKITWETLGRQVGGLLKTGDTQICIMDFENDIIYLSNSGYGTGENAFERPFIKLNLQQFFY